MNEMNFDGLKNIKAPQAWLDRAAAIPETCARKHTAVPVYRIAAAASIVLVSVIGLLLFLFFGNGSDMPVAVRESAVETADLRTGETVPYQGDSIPIPAETIAVLSTDADGNTVITYRDAPAPTEKALSPISPTVPTAPGMTEKPAPTATPTEHTSSPTQPPAAPTDPPKPTAPPATQKPTEGYRPPGDTDFYGLFSIDDPGMTSGSGWNVAEELTVFCRLYDSSGNLVGDSPLYHPQREATILSTYDDGTVLVYYNPAEKGLSVTEDGYEYVFYDIHGNELYRSIKFVF